MHSKKKENQILNNFPNSHSKRPNSWLQQQALLHPEQPALYSKNRCLTFSELNHYVQKYAQYYLQKMDKNVQRVAILSENCEEMYLSILGLWELGIEIQFLNTRLTKNEILDQLSHAQTDVLIAPVKQAMREIQMIFLPKIKEVATISTDSTIDSGYMNESIASIMYTSGTTGKPKGVPQTFANHCASSLATKEKLSVKVGDSWLCCVPLYHISGLSIVLRSLVLGISVYLLPNFDAEKINKIILKGKVNHISMVTKMLKDQLPLIPVGGYPKQLCTVLLGGGPVDTAVIRACQEKHLPIVLSYGMTETCSQVVATNKECKPGSSGYPLANVRVKIKGTIEPYVAGEILLRGPSIISNYLDDEHVHVVWTSDGWFCTGDWGYLDEEGELFLVSRMNEQIISGGENIYPAEIEEALLRSEKISEAVVVGKTDDTWGQRPVAYIKLLDPLEEPELRQLLQPVASYKHPDELFVVHTIPKTASGKNIKRIFLTEERVKYIDYRLY
ncbi:o-succinylbenzoate--CoA ligase [Enterococcus durans]|uniref:o-succinylbenzoate--CoA ligase n=1 Tax=Enterococcus durans TaxID=53345 RepID=UPI001158B0C6|nr:o-succinylbenzoate--CoA ligase [Enterococcus durans]